MRPGPTRRRGSSRALPSAIFEAGPSPEDIVMIEFDPVRSAKLDKALAGIARMGRPSVPELSRLVAAGGVVGALAAATLGSIGPDAASAAPNLLAAVLPLLRASAALASTDLSGSRFWTGGVRFWDGRVSAPDKGGDHREPASGHKPFPCSAMS
jgi:hypothetical protein